MKTFKHVTMVLLFSTIAIHTMAQESTSNLGLQFGFAQTDFRLNSWDPKADPTALINTALNGLKFGLVWEGTFIKGFGSLVGLNYTFGTYSSGWKKIGAFDYPQEKEKNNYHQLEIFVDWQYKFEIAGNTYVIVYTGPTIQCQLALTNTTFRKELDGTESSTSISRFDYDDDKMHQDYKRLNVTWGVGAGFQYDRFYIRGGYDFGLINPYKINDFSEVFGNVYGENHDSGRRTRGRIDQWHITLGFYFARF